MRAMRWTMAMGVAAVLASSGAWAQEGGRPGSRRGGREWQMRAETAMMGAVATVATNDVVAQVIGLTDAQVALLKDKLQAEKVRTALSAVRLAEAVTVVLTDPGLVAELELTPDQVSAIKQTMTPKLILQALTPQDIAKLANDVSSGVAAGAAMQAMQERMKQFDKDGDGQISEEERQEAMNAWRERRGRRGDRNQ